MLIYRPLILGSVSVWYKLTKQNVYKCTQKNHKLELGLNFLRSSLTLSRMRTFISSGQTNGQNNWIIKLECFSTYFQKKITLF